MIILKILDPTREVVNMKKTFLILLTVLVSFNVSAQSIKKMWLAMPDSVIPYLNANLRQEFLDFADMKVKASVKNLLNGNSRMDTLTNDYLHVILNPSTTLEMKMLPRQNGDSVLCFVKTLSAPSKESEILFYDRSWHRLSSKDLMPEVKPEDFIVRPDTMPADRFQFLEAMIEPYLVSGKLSPNDRTMVLSLAVPLVGSMDEKAVNTILVQKKLNWENERFK